MESTSNPDELNAIYGAGIIVTFLLMLVFGGRKNPPRKNSHVDEDLPPKDDQPPG